MSSPNRSPPPRRPPSPRRSPPPRPRAPVRCGLGLTAFVTRAVFVGLAALSGLAFAPGCKSGTLEATPLPPPQRYAARGIVRNVAQAEGKSVLLIHHERIENYVGRDGQTKAMPSMAMPFGVGPSVSLEGLKPDEKIEFDFSVDWSRYPPSVVETLRALPTDASLALQAPR